MKALEIYTDGACRGNPGAGGWGVYLLYKNEKKEFYGGKLNTTNNQMELTAVIEGLKVLKEPCKVKLYTDSKYVMDGRITEAREVILLIKTTEKLEDKVYKIIKEHHNYEIPEISTIQTSNVDKDYEQWLKDFVEE